MQTVVTAILSNRKHVHGVFLKLYLRNNMGQFKAKRQWCSVIWGQFQATGTLWTKVLHGVFHRLWLHNNTGQFEAKGQLRRVF